MIKGRKAISMVLSGFVALSCIGFESYAYSVEENVEKLSKEYAVYQGSIFLGSFGTRDAAVAEGKKWSNSRVEHDGESVWKFGDHLYAVYQGSALLGSFGTRDAAVAEGKKWSNSRVEHDGESVWKFGDHLYAVYQGSALLGNFGTRDAAVAEGKKWSNSRVEHDGKSVWKFGDHLYAVYQGSALLGNFGTRDAAVREAKKWSNSRVSREGILTWSWALDIESPSAVLIDRETGEVLYEKNMDQVRAIASTSKIMTYILAMEAVEKGNAKLTDRVKVSYRAGNTGGSSYKLKAGDILTLGELLESLMIISANDSAVAIAEHISGSVEKFAIEMNRKSLNIGLKSARFINPNGLPLHDDSQNSMTTYDLAILSKYAIDKYGNHLIPITRKTGFWGSYKQFYGKSTNAFIDGGLFVDGLKTGYTRKAGVCIVSTAKIKGDENNRVIAVVLGNKSSKGVYADAKKLINHIQKN